MYKSQKPDNDNMGYPVSKKERAKIMQECIRQLKELKDGNTFKVLLWKSKTKRRKFRRIKQLEVNALYSPLRGRHEQINESLFSGRGEVEFSITTEINV